MAEEQIKLTLVERLILRNQFEILGKLSPKEAKWYDLHIEALDNAYEHDYPNMFKVLSREPFTRDQSREVIDILDMYRHLQFSFSQLKNPKKLKASDVGFPGFDGNHETEVQYMAYAAYLVKDDHFGMVKLENKNSFNSHREMLERYRRMLPAWKMMKRDSDLSEDQITLILGKQ